ncbi:hypothetical protein L249_3535 [Ophiocordyceps polyrhachis-furcata BCC 54312]|uniref:Uncharacterized protein n=1 Tax=Ophiocordyceps polyrhachis-furcata BCC 54312 TaxID=1330021 RepID=A0A367LMQ5_9HYPO|nr:hypothetical protein L249_3535 [Ophiocordyceps polyrhachis-furcata BCC 54312]
MFSTKVARSVRDIFANYIEPPSLSRKQSEKLLNGLKTSFRSQLDREYGHASANQVGRDAEGRPLAVSQHLRSILSDPLFSCVRSSPAAQSNVPPSPILKRDPMDVFDYAVSKDMMTFEAATGCLLTKKLILDRAEVDPASSDTASRVMRWLRRSGYEKDLCFLYLYKRIHFVRSLMPFLIYERQESVAWNWISRLINGDGMSLSPSSRCFCASQVLTELVSTKSQPQHGGLDAAIRTMLEAEQRFQNSPSLQRLLIASWRRISWISTVNAETIQAPSEKLFEAHLVTARDHLLPLPIENAHLRLHHPTRPNLDPAMDLVRDRTQIRKMVSAFKPAMFKFHSKLLWLAYLGRDTATSLTRLGRDDEADEVTDLLRAELPHAMLAAAAATLSCGQRDS